MRLLSDQGFLAVAGFGLCLTIVVVTSMAKRRHRSVLACWAGVALLYPVSFSVLVALSSPFVMLMATVPYRGVERDAVILIFLWSAFSAGLTSLLMRIFLGGPLFRPEDAGRRSQTAWRPRPGKHEVAGHLMADVAFKTSKWGAHLRQRERHGP